MIYIVKLEPEPQKNSINLNNKRLKEHPPTDPNPKTPKNHPKSKPIITIRPNKDPHNTTKGPKKNTKTPKPPTAQKPTKKQKPKHNHQNYQKPSFKYFLKKNKHPKTKAVLPGKPPNPLPGRPGHATMCQAPGQQTLLGRHICEHRRPFTGAPDGEHQPEGKGDLLDISMSIFLYIDVYW